MFKIPRMIRLVLIFTVLFGLLVSCTSTGAPETVIVTQLVEGEVVEKIITTTPVPQEELIGPIRVTYPAIPQGAYLASLLSWPQMATRNILVEPQFLARTDLAVQAVINGDVELGIAPTNLIVESNLRGADLVIIMTTMRNDWTVASPVEYESFADLEGKRVAVHGPGSLAELYTLILEEEYDVDVEIVTIPGSAVRAQAILAGEVEASPLFLTDLLMLDMESPGEFHVLVNLAEEFPENPVNVLFARRDWVEENSELVTNIIAEMLETHQRVADDPDWAIAQAPAYLGALKRELVEALVPEYVRLGIWPLDGGLDETIAQAMLDFLITRKAFGDDLVVEELLVEDHFDFRPLKSALELLDSE